jgi:hypothetical protein
MELAPAFPGGIAITGRRLSLAGKAAQGVDGAAAGNDVCRSGDAYGLRRRITLSAIGPECPGDIDRYGGRHVGIDPAVRHSNTDGELEQNPEITDGIERWDQFQYPFIFHLACHPCHQHVVIYSVEEFFQVEVYDPSLPLEKPR